MADVFSKIFGQPKVSEFLRRSAAEEHIAQSYLFLGPSGSNKTQAAYALACAFLCGTSKNCAGTCSLRESVLAHKHPDVKFYSPGGESGYLVSQIHEIIHDSTLAPVRGNKKVYILDRVDLLGASSANAFLKTLEEPTSGTCFILLGRCANSVLPTIRSRCLVVPFRQIPPAQAISIIMQNTIADEQKAQIALSASGNSITAAIKMLTPGDNSLIYLREQIVKIVLGAVVSTDWGVLKAVKDLLLLVKSPTDEYRQRLEESLCDSDDFLSDAAKKQLEKANKRSVKRKESKLINMIFDCIISLMHDVMMILANDSRRVVNSDFFEELKSFANKTNQIKMGRALDQVISLKNANTYNVSSESLLDLALFEFKGAQE